MRSWRAVLFCALSACSGPAVEDETSEVSSPLASLAADGTWSSYSIGARRTLRVRASASGRHRLSWTDHYGYLRDQRRPACALDVATVDADGRALAPVSHNSSRDANGTEPDPIEIDMRGETRIEIREVDGYACRFQMKLERVRGEAPAGLMVHARGATDRDAAPVTRSTLLLAGGGPDNDEAMRALVEGGGSGDAVILRMDDTGGAYADYALELGAASAREIVFDPANGNANVGAAELAGLRALANDPWVERTIDRAEVLFFAGGNQTKYFDAWSGTRLAAAVSRASARGAAIGGTSAGMHAMGKLVHTPRGDGDSVLSRDALLDPYIAPGEVAGSRSLSFSDGLFAIPGLEDIVMDTHWSERDRLGRSLVFLARALQDGLRPLGDLRMIACDEGVAVVIDASGVGRVYGGGSAFFLRPDKAVDLCADDRPLEWSSGVPIVEVPGGGQVDLRAWPQGPRRAVVTAGAVAVRSAER
jgi:cyanophycinase-like exopeptidase